MGKQRKEEKETVEFTLSKREFSALKRLSKMTKLSIEEVIERTIKLYLKEKKEKH